VIPICKWQEEIVATEATTTLASTIAETVGETLVETTFSDEYFEEKLLVAYETGRAEGIASYKKELMAKTKKILRANMFRDFGKKGGKKVEIDQNEEGDFEHSARLKSGVNPSDKNLNFEFLLLKLLRRSKS